MEKIINKILINIEIGSMQETINIEINKKEGIDKEDEFGLIKNYVFYKSNEIFDKAINECNILNWNEEYDSANFENEENTFILFDGKIIDLYLYNSNKQIKNIYLHERYPNEWNVFKEILGLSKII